MTQIVSSFALKVRAERENRVTPHNTAVAFRPFSFHPLVLRAPISYIRRPEKRSRLITTIFRSAYLILLLKFIV